MYGKMAQNKGREIKVKYGMLRIVIRDGLLFLGIWSKFKEGIPLEKNEVTALIRGLRRLKKSL